MSKQTPTGTVPQTTGTIREATSAFENLMVVVDSDGKPLEDEAKPDEAVEAEAQGSEVEAEAVEAADGEAEEQVEEQEAGEQPPASQKFTLNIEGKDVELDEAELKNGYLRQADYTRKTQATAAERKALQAEADSARQERAEYAQLLPKLRAALEAGIGPEPDWPTLRAEDPVKAAVKWQEREEMRRKLDLAKQEEQRVAKQTAADREQETEQALIAQRNTLLEKLPEWRDEKVAGAESAAIHELLLSAGYSEDEAVIYDHRAILIARKAAKYDALIAQRKKVEKTVVNAPVNRSGGAVRTSTAKEAQRAASARFEKTGSVKDAARVFESFLS